MRSQPTPTWRVSLPDKHRGDGRVECETQAEIDRLWDALKENGSTEQFGWLRDRWAAELADHPEAARRAYGLSRPRQGQACHPNGAQEATFDIAGLEAAAEGLA
jgi:hypothetical protein